MRKGKKNNFITPLFITFAIAMFIMAIISLFWNPIVFVCELVLSLIAVMVVIFSYVNVKSYISNVVSDGLSAVGDSNERTINSVSVPAVIIGANNEIILSNKLFREALCNDENPVGDNISDYLSNSDPNEMYHTNGVDTFHNGKWYIVFAVRNGTGAAVYFADDNTYKINSDEYLASKPVVAIVNFDNSDDLEREVKDDNAGQVMVLVEKAIIKWATATTGFYKKLNGGRYLIVMEERHIKQFIEEKFKILEEVRAIKISDHLCATISIGVGYGGTNLKENELWARQALDMALGRGGDQVAVKKLENYKFFGGVSKGIEKRNNVRTRVIASMLTTHVNNSSNVLIMGHRFSDLDAVGAAIGMWSGIVKGLHRNAYIVINKQQSLAKPLIATFEKAGFESIFKTESEALDIMDDRTLVVIVDTHSPNFLESKAIYERGKRIVVIDHHRMMTNRIENTVVFHHEPYASSASEMVSELGQYLYTGKDSISRLESEALLAGIMLDTKNFVLRTGVRTFEEAAYLRSNGADTVEVKRMFSNSIDTYKVKYKLVSEAEIFNSCAIACADENTPDIRIASAQAADELLGIENVKASFVMYKTGKTVNISARSLGDMNVQVIMEMLGGGGHQTMAACQMDDVTMAEAREKLVSILSGLEFNEQENKPA